MSLLNYADPAVNVPQGVVVTRTGDALSVSWPAETIQSRRFGAYGSLILGLLMMGLGGWSPGWLQHLVGTRPSRVDWVSTFVGLLWTAQGVRGCWRIHRWPTVVQTLTLTPSRVTWVRMGLWWPRVRDRPASDVVDFDWSPASEFLWGRGDPRALTLRFARGQRWRLIFRPGQHPPQAAISEAISDLLPEDDRGRDD